MSQAQKEDKEVTGEINQEVPTISTLLKRKKITDVSSQIQKTKTTTNINTISIKSAIPNHTKSNIVPIDAPKNETVQIDVSQLNKANSGIKQKTITNIPVMTNDNLSLEIASQKQNYNRNTQGVPVFTKTLELEKFDLKQLSKNVKAKKSLALRKLDCLGYFHTLFDEIAYFESPAPGQMNGRLGFGNFQLITDIRSKQINAQSTPSIYDQVGSNQSDVYANEKLNSTDLNALKEIGFTAQQSIGVFPVHYEKQVIGVWICTSSKNVELEKKDLSTLSKLFSDLVL